MLTTALVRLIFIGDVKKVLQRIGSYTAELFQDGLFALTTILIHVHCTLPKCLYKL